jgi:hypothetical protein
VIGRIAGDAVLLDLRTVAPDQRPMLGGALRTAVATAAVGAPGAPRP